MTFRQTWRRGAQRETAALAWPLALVRLSIMATAVVDTVMAGQRSAVDLAAVGLGASVYIIIFVAALGVLLALPPQLARHYGAARHHELSSTAMQGIWTAALLGVACGLALWNCRPVLAWAAADPKLVNLTESYLKGCAVAVPAILIFRVFYSVSMAMGAAKLIAAINVALVVVKVPLNGLLMGGVPGMLEPLGAAGCGVSLAVISWVAVVVVIVSFRRHRTFRVLQLRFERPKRREIGSIMRTGYPISLMQVAEVASFAAMGICVARLEPAQIAAHQAAANIATTLFMLPFALSLASSVLVSRALGAGDAAAEQRASRAGLQMSIATAVALGALIVASSRLLVRFYTQDPKVAAYLETLLVWIAASQLADCVQVYLLCLLRSYGLTFAPSMINIAAQGGVGFVGGYLLAFGPMNLGTTGFWAGSFCGLCVSAAALWTYTRRSVWAPVEVRATSPG